MKKKIPVFQFFIIIGLIIYMIVDHKNPFPGVEPQWKASNDEALVLASNSENRVYTYEIPEEIDLAGEAVPLDDYEVRQRLDRELHVNTHWNSNTIFLMKRSNQWFPHMASVLQENGIPQDFLYLPLIESGLLNVKSPAGATGFWQLMESTAKELGLEVNDEVDERFNAIKSTEAACKYLNMAYNKFGNWTNVAASYNVGMYGLQRSLLEQKVESYYDLLLNDETSRYVFRILAIKEILKNPAKYGYNIPDNQLYPAEDLRELIIDRNIPDLVEFSIAHGINYKILKHYNPWLRKKSLTIKKSGHSYTILLPKHPVSFQKMASDKVIKEEYDSTTSSINISGSLLETNKSDRF